MGYDRAKRGEVLDDVEKDDPAKHAELLELRAANPQAYRKQIIRIARKRGFHLKRRRD